MATRNADVAQLVEHHLAKVRVAGSNPVVRSKKMASDQGNWLSRPGDGMSGLPIMPITCPSRSRRRAPMLES